MRDDVTRGGIIPPSFEDEETAGVIRTNSGDFLTCLVDLNPVKAPRPAAAAAAAGSLQQVVAISSSVSSSRDVSMLLEPICLGSAAHEDVQQDAAIEEAAEAPLTVPDTPRYLNKRGDYTTDSNTIAITLHGDDSHSLIWLPLAYFFHYCCCFAACQTEYMVMI